MGTIFGTFQVTYSSELTTKYPSASGWENWRDAKENYCFIDFSFHQTSHAEPRTLRPLHLVLQNKSSPRHAHKSHHGTVLLGPGMQNSWLRDPEHNVRWPPRLTTLVCLVFFFWSVTTIYHISIITRDYHTELELLFEVENQLLSNNMYQKKTLWSIECRHL